MNPEVFRDGPIAILDAGEVVQPHIGTPFRPHLGFHVDLGARDRIDFTSAFWAAGVRAVVTNLEDEPERD